MSRGRDLFRKLKPVIDTAVKVSNLLPKRLRNKLFEAFRNTKGKKGMLVRYILLRTLAKSVGDNVSIFPNVYLLNVEELKLGNNVSIHPMSYIEAWGGIEIGDDVSIAHAVTLLSVNHNYDDLNLNIKDQGLEKRPITIKSNVWIGAKASILGGVTINSGSVVALGAVVSKDVAENSVVAGVPAAILKNR